MIRFTCILLLILSTATYTFHLPPPAHAQQNHYEPPRWVPGEVIVQTRSDSLETMAESSMRSLEDTNTRLTVKRKLPQTNTIIYKTAPGTEEAVVTQLRQNVQVEFASKNYLYEPQRTFNDPQPQWHLNKILAHSAWDTSIGSSDQIIAILDTGVDSNHPDLIGRLLSGRNFYDNNTDITDSCGHGTMVAGVVGASTNNNTGVAGVTWNPRILPIKISQSDCYGSWEAIMEGLVYAADNGARIANISFRIYDGFYLTPALQYFVGKGGVVFAAAGNEGGLQNFPDNPYLISVGATNENDALTSFSDWGPYVDIVAPGINIMTTVTNNPFGQYGPVYGTSFSSPIAAGVAALVMDTDPTLSPQEVEGALEQTAQDLGQSGYDTTFGWGRINAHAAVQYAKTATAPQPLPGDVDGNNRVEIADLATLLANFGRMGRTRQQGDIVGNDGMVTIADLTMLLTNFGRSS